MTAIIPYGPQPLITISILTIEPRYFEFNSLWMELTRQVAALSKKHKCNMFDRIELLSDSRPSEFTKGEKRNACLSVAAGKYHAFFDDDDRPSEGYVEALWNGAHADGHGSDGPDCLSLRGVITDDGKNPRLFEHSLKYNAWKENTGDEPIKYERFPNHLNCIRTEIARQFKFPEKNFGEDFDFSCALHESGLLKTEEYIDEVLYYYDYKSKK